MFADAGSILMLGALETAVVVCKEDPDSGCSIGKKKERKVGVQLYNALISFFYFKSHTERKFRQKW